MHGMNEARSDIWPSPCMQLILNDLPSLTQQVKERSENFPLEILRGGTERGVWETSSACQNYVMDGFSIIFPFEVTEPKELGMNWRR